MQGLLQYLVLVEDEECGEFVDEISDMFQAEGRDEGDDSDDESDSSDDDQSSDRDAKTAKKDKKKRKKAITR